MVGPGLAATYHAVNPPLYPMRLALCSLLLVAGTAVSAQTPTSPVDSASYDVYAQLPREEQIRLFDQISLEERAAIAREQSTRWLAANRATLSPKQIAVVEEAIEAINPAWYGPGATEEAQAELEAIMAPVMEVLTHDQVFRAFIAGAPYIPPQD